LARLGKVMERESMLAQVSSCNIRLGQNGSGYSRLGHVISCSDLVRLGEVMSG
jgi:hypothetical protein